MSANPEQALIFHITDLADLPGILAENGLRSDAVMAEKNPTVIGYGHIKERRLKEIRVAFCAGRFVGEFVPSYFCPRSPMLLSKVAKQVQDLVDSQHHRPAVSVEPTWYY